jgi:PAS domain-containing protein
VLQATPDVLPPAHSAAPPRADALVECVLRASFDGMAALLADGTVAAANPLARDLLGLTDGAAAGRRVWQRCRALAPEARQRLRALVESGRPGTIEAERPRAPPLELRWQPSSRGRRRRGPRLPRRARGVAPVRAPQAAGPATPAQDPELLRVMLDHLPGVLALKDAASRRFLEVRGAEVVSPGDTAASMVGKTAHEIYPPALAAEIDAVESAVLAKAGAVHETQFRIEGRGRPQWFLSKKLAILGPDGAPSYLLTYNIEITAQVEAQRALDRSNAFLDAVIDYMPALVAVREIGTGRLVRVNRQFGELLGLPAGEAPDLSAATLPEPVGRVLQADDAHLRR